MVCDSVIMIVYTRSAGGPLGLALLFSWMATDQKSLWVNHCATTKEACLVAVPISPWISLSSGI
jgi:hypothetical protein